MEAKFFMTTDDFDMAPINGRIEYWMIKRRSYDFKTVEENSMFRIAFKLNMGIGCELQASGKNCNYLKKIMDRYVMPNLKEYAVSNR